MGIGVIPITILVDSHSHSQVLFNSCLIPMGLPWDSHSYWDFQSNAHLYPTGRCAPNLAQLQSAGVAVVIICDNFLAIG